MMNLLQSASDDQMALIGCLVTLVGSAGLMYLSFFVGPAGRRHEEQLEAESTMNPISMRPGLETPQERAA